MNNYLVIDAISYLDMELLAVHLEKKDKLRTRVKTRKKTFLHWSAIAACITLILCLAPILNMIFDGSHSGGVISIHYANINEAHEQLGFDTLYGKLDYDHATTRSISVSYPDEGEGIATLDEPFQLLVRQTYDNENGVVNADFYVLFNKEDVNDTLIAGYEEQGLSKLVNGVVVYYSIRFNDEDNRAQAKFIYDGNLYVINVRSTGEFDLDYFLDKLLK